MNQVQDVTVPALMALEMIADEVATERARLRRSVDRLDALASLELFTKTAQARAGRDLSFEEIFDQPRDAVERAHLDALAERITKEVH